MPSDVSCLMMCLKFHQGSSMAHGAMLWRMPEAIVFSVDTVVLVEGLNPNNCNVLCAVCRHEYNAIRSTS